MNSLAARTAGWYDAHAEAVGKEKCVFCDLRQKYIVIEDSGVVLTENIFPYTDGHLLVVPRRHVESLLDLEDQELLASRRLALRGIELVKAELELESYWFLLREGPAAGKTVKHLHFQVMPYHEGIVTWNYAFKEPTIGKGNLAPRLRARL